MGLFRFGKKRERAAEERAAASSAGSSAESSREIEFTSGGGGAELLTAILGGAGKVTAETAMQIPAVARCVHMVAQAAAMLPVKMYRKGENGVEEIASDRRVDMLNGETGDSIPGAYMRYRWVRDVLLTGAAYGFIERVHGVPARIFYVSPEEVGVVRDPESVIHKNYWLSVRGKRYYPFEFLKILRCSDGFGKGRGLISENPLVLDTAYSLFKFQRNQLAKGGAKKGFLRTDKHVGDPAIKEVKEKWRRLYSNQDTEAVMFLNEGIDFKEISNSAVEMQVNQSMRTVNDEILRLFGSEDGMLTAETVKNAVMPVLDMIETAFDSDLLLESEKGKVYFAFDTKELTRGDIGARFGAYASALDKGFMQIDEVRELEDLPALGIDFIKLNLADSFYDPKTKRIYTPNTNQWTDFGEGGQSECVSQEEQAEDEVRFNPYHDPENGRFTTADGGSAGNSKNGLDKSEKSGIIKTGNNNVNFTAEKEVEYGVKYAENSVNADMEYINSEEYAEKFRDITPNEKVNQMLLECSRKAIEHRNGTLYEDMYLINADTGEIEGFQLNALNPQGIDYNDSLNNAIAKAKENNIPLIALHTHPEGYPPSIDDFNSLYNHDYALGIVAGHNGQVYVFRKPDELIEDAEGIQRDIVLAYQGGADVDRAYREAYMPYNIDYSIKGGISNEEA